MRRVPFPSKLALAALWPALTALAVAAALWGSLLPRLVERSAAAELRHTLPLVIPWAAELGEREPAEIQAVLREAARASGRRITLVAGDGRVLADSATALEQIPALDNHGNRPEIRDAFSRGEGTSVRRSRTTGERYVYAALRLNDRQGRLYALRLAEPLAELAAARRHLWQSLAAAGTIAIAATAVIWWWLARRLFRPLSLLIADAQRLASGELEHPVAVPDQEELASLAGALNRLSDRVRAHLAAVVAERGQLESILASMREGVLVTDPQGRALFANPAFRRFFGYQGELAGRSPLEITRQPQLAALIADTLALGPERRQEIEVAGPVRRVLSLLGAALEECQGAVVVARDITEAIRLSEMRRDFVANVSHELKTPLAAIRGYAETLREAALDDRERAVGFVDRILQHSQRLQALLDDLLTLSRLESPPPGTERRPVDLGRLAERALDLVAQQAAGREVQLVLAPAEVAPVVGDPWALERLALNLLDNAIKYNRRGGQVRVSVRRAGPEVLLEVTDTGIGIPADALPRIFERFYRVDKGRSRGEGGTGLGLAIVKHAAQSHGGRVEVQSTVGEGSVFRVFLPAG